LNKANALRLQAMVDEATTPAPEKELVTV
jgi:hypothetical protein